MLEKTCPVEHALEILEGKWTILVVHKLLSGVKRFGELRRSLHPIPWDAQRDEKQRKKSKLLLNPMRHTFIVVLSTHCFQETPMNKLTPSTTRLSPLPIFFTTTLLLLLTACGSQQGPTSASSTSKHTSITAGTVSAGTPQLTQQYEFTEQDSGKTLTYIVTTRFIVILNAQTYPKGNLQVSCSPTGTLGAISNLPSEAPPLYAVRYEGVQPDSCTIKNGPFHLTVKILASSSAREPIEGEG